MTLAVLFCLLMTLLTIVFGINYSLFCYCLFQYYAVVQYSEILYFIILCVVVLLFHFIVSDQ